MSKTPSENLPKFQEKITLADAGKYFSQGLVLAQELIKADR
jgi:hypothetical protein